MNLVIYRFNEQLQAMIRQGMADGIPEYVMQYILKDAYLSMSPMVNSAIQKEAKQAEQEV